MKSTRTLATPARAAADDLRAFLAERFQSAVRRNPRFSLRAFARQLGIDHSTLSQVLRKKRRLSATAVEAIGRRLGLSAEAIAAYRRRSGGEPSSGAPVEAPRAMRFDLDTFQLLSVWFHSAILELSQVRGFKADSRWIAKTLGISVTDINIAVQRLLRLGLLEMAGRDRWLDRSGDAEFEGAALTEAAGRRIDQEAHGLAMRLISRLPEEHRVQATMIVAIDSRQLPELRLLVDQFIGKVRELLARGAVKDDVYQMELSFLPVTTLKQRKEKDHG